MSLIKILENLLTAAIPTIIEAGKNFLSKLNETPSIKSSNTAMDIEQINNALSLLRDYVLEQSNSSIKNANESVMVFIEEQFFSLESKAELLAKYQISSRSVERRLNDIKNQLQEFWKDSIYRRISLDNERCRAILTLPKGARRESEIATFTQEVLNNTLDEYAEGIREALSKLYLDLEEDINHSIETLERTAKKYGELCDSYDEEDKLKYEQILNEAKEKIYCYEVVIDKLEC